jgi:HAD superfamily hydrolase (TIGR01509 family)
MIKGIVFDYYKVIYIPETQQIDKEVVSILKKLKKTKIPLHLFTNTSQDYVERMDRKTKFLKYFKERIYCIEYVKPNEKAFEKLINTLNILPSKILLIDDDLLNINMATQLGIQTIQYIDPVDLKNNLNKYVNYDN